jgi:hypothetical protein
LCFWTLIGVGVLLSACTASGGVVSSTAGPTAASSIAVVTPDPGGDLPPVSISNPSAGAKDALAKCHIGDQFPSEWIAGMAQIPSARDIGHYVPLTGREPELKVDSPVWVIQFRGDLPMRDGIWTDPICVVAADSSGFYATGPTTEYDSGTISTPEPPPTPPDRRLPPLAP